MGDKITGPFQNHPKSHLSDIPPFKFSHPMDESSDFHDPYSDLNLFLTQKVKEEFQITGGKKWSIQLQEQLIAKIGPEFQKRFPRSRLGVAALKKIWEKVAYYSHTFESQKEALTSDGKLNLSFLIRENLKQLFKQKNRQSFHPYLIAQQIALKISECLAAYDGIRPMLQHMTKMIWAVERHLIPPQQVPSLTNPYEECDKWDKLILKFMLEALGKNPGLSQQKLQDIVRNIFHTLDAIEQESVNILIDNPHLTFDTCLETARVFFQKARELVSTANWVELEHKITFWTIQADLVYRYIRIERNPLLDLIIKKDFLPSPQQITKEYLQYYPFLSEFYPQIFERCEIFIRYVWYYVLSSPEQSTVDRFFEWHLNQDISIDQLEEICKNRLPLLPFDRMQF